MPAPQIDSTASLSEIRDEVVFTLQSLSEDPEARDLAPRFRVLLDRGSTVLLSQLSRWDAQKLCSLRIGSCDTRLDEAVKDFGRALLTISSNDRSDPHYQHYFPTGSPPSEVIRPVLGPELDTVRAWLPALQGEAAAPISRFHARFAALVTEADLLLVAESEADGENSRFRNLGELATFVNDVQTERDACFAILDRRVTKLSEKNLPRDWASGFFRSRKPLPQTDEEKKAMAEKRAQARRDADAQAKLRGEAIQKIREGKAALKSLKKK